MKGKEDWIGTSDEISYVKKFMKHFSLTNDENDYLESSKIQ